MAAAEWIDTHAHVFHQGLTAVAGARYAPSYDASLDDYLAFLDRNGIARGVLVQPSFLGSDNGFMLERLDAAGGRLAGVAVAEDGLDAGKARSMAARGVVGLRFNLVGRQADLLSTRANREAAARAARLGWHVELHANAPGIAKALPLLAGFDGPVVIDHFGRPDGPEALATALAWRADPRIHVKLSGPYRFPSGALPDLAARFVDAYGAERLMWGSDWPWTQFEQGIVEAGILPGAYGLDGETLATMNRTARKLFFPDHRGPGAPES